MEIKIQSLWPLIAFIILILLLDLVLFLMEGDAFVASKFIQHFEINQLLMPLPLIKYLI